MFPRYIIKVQYFEDNDHNASNRLSHEQEKIKYSEKVITHSITYTLIKPDIIHLYAAQDHYSMVFISPFHVWRVKTERTNSDFFWSFYAMY